MVFFVTARHGELLVGSIDTGESDLITMGNGKPFDSPLGLF